VNSSYGFLGVVPVFALYLAKKRQTKAIVILVWAVVLYLGRQAFTGAGFNWSQIHYSNILNCACAALAAVPIWFYNGQRGKPHKFWAYAYYPAHLFVLWLARFLILPPT
jgi:hypothetical protein